MMPEAIPHNLNLTIVQFPQKSKPSVQPRPAVPPSKGLHSRGRREESRRRQRGLAEVRHQEQEIPRNRRVLVFRAAQLNNEL